MKRILFVDDETNVLDGLRGLLRRHRRRWEMVFACGGEAAVEEIEKQPFDVVVSDMRMPGMDGAALLRFVQEKHPEAVRIVLSGQTEQEIARRMVHVAHQFLAKPCDPAQLEGVIERACNLQRLLADAGLRETVGRIGQLPAVPSVFRALTAALEDPNASLKDMAGIVQQEPATAAKILQVVNSAFFGLPRRVADIEQAVCYVGADALKGLALLIEVFEPRGGVPAVAGFSIDALQRRSLLTARFAKHLLGEFAGEQDAFVAGMLHDLGILILATQLPEHLARLLAESKASGRPMHVVEREMGPATHAEIGAYLLGLWGLPYPIVEAVAHHHEPARVPTESFDVLGALYVSRHLVEEAGGKETAPGPLLEPLDEEFLDRIGVAGRMPEWRAAVRKEMAAEGAA